LVWCQCALTKKNLQNLSPGVPFVGLGQAPTQWKTQVRTHIEIHTPELSALKQVHCWPEQ